MSEEIHWLRKLMRDYQNPKIYEIHKILFMMSILPLYVVDYQIHKDFYDKE